MSSHTICVVGSVNIDTTYSVRQIPGPGETILADARRVSHGGKGANQAAAAAASGGSVAMIATVGDDENGAAAVHDLEVRGVDVDGIARTSGRATGNAVILVGADGENLIVVDPGANHALEADLGGPARRAARPGRHARPARDPHGGPHRGSQRALRTRCSSSTPHRCPPT